jgi:hypothetical protein
MKQIRLLVGSTLLLPLALIAQPETTAVINNIHYANAYPGADACAKIANAMAALPGTGGTVDARGLQGPQSCAADPFSGITTANITLLLGKTEYRLNGVQWQPTVLPLAIVGDQQETTLSNYNNTRQTGAMIKAGVSAGNQQVGLTIRDINFSGGTSDSGNNYHRGIQVINAAQVLIDHNRFFGFEAGSDDAWVIYFEDKVQRSRITNNYVGMLTRQVGEAGFGVGVLVHSPFTGAYNGQVAGDGSPLPATTDDILIQGNQISGGTHGIDLQNTSHVRIVNNQVKNSSHRNIILYATNDHVTVTGNDLSNAGSVNILADYGLSNAVISGNTIDTTTGGEGNCIELHSKISSVAVTGNSIAKCLTNGVFLGTSAKNITISGNTFYDWSNGATTYAGVKIQGTMSNAPELASPFDSDAILISGNSFLQDLGTSRYGVFIQAKAPGSGQADRGVTAVISGNTFEGGNFPIFFTKNSTTAPISVTVPRGNHFANYLGAVPIFASDTGIPGTVEFECAAAPTLGYWAVGARCWNNGPTSPIPESWVNILAGNPGTWIPEGATASIASPNTVGVFAVDINPPQNTSSGAILAASNQTRIFPFVLPFAVKIANLTFEVTTGGGASKLLNLAICSLPCNTSDIKVQTGAIDANTTGVRTQAVTAATLPSGTYALMFTSDSATTQMRLSQGGALPPSSFLNSRAIKKAGVCASPSSVAVFSNCGTVSATTTNYPLTYLEP